MKNFTNKFKNNILFKPTRLLFVVLMLLVGTGTAFANGDAGGPKGVYLNVNGTNTWYNVYSVSWSYNPSCSGWNTFKTAASISGKDLGTVTTFQLKGYAVIGWTDNSDWVSGELRYQINSGSYNYFKVGNWDSGSSAADVKCSSGNDRVVGLNNQSVNLLTGLTPGNHTIKFMPSGRMRYNGGNFNPVSHPELSAKFTVPGYSTTTGTLAIGEVGVGSNGSGTKTITHYGSTTTATYAISGTNASEFSVTSCTATNITVKFTPTSVGSKTATIKITDAYSKTYTLTVTGTGKQDCISADYTVSFANGATSVNKGSTLQASVSPSGDGHGTVTWSSSATSVATVNSSGLITGVKGGTATITATVAKGDTYCGGEDSKTITVKETPAVTISGTQEFCGASTTLTATVTGVSNGVSHTINWYKDGGATSVGTGATYNATASGTYTAKVTGTYINTTTSAGYAVTKKTAPTKPTIKANKTISNGTVSLMSGESVTFSVTQVAGETYTWYRGQGNIVHTGATYTTNVNGSYTVKATNSCGDSELSSAVTVSVCEPIKGISWEITSGEKATYCPGDIVVVTLTYNGSAATDYAWGGDNGGISKAGGTITSGSKYQFTLYNTGNINMTLTGCDGETATTETLYFTVATGPAKPDLSPGGTINVGQNKSTTITVNKMDANATYVCYNANDQEVGTWNGNSVTFNVGDETGNFTYSIVATNKTCGDLTAETEFTIKVEEAGVKIAALGSKALYTNDPTHFIPLYVSNEDLAGAGVGATSVKKYTWQFSANGTSGWADCTRNYGNFNAKNNKSESKVVVSNGGEKSNNYRANQVGYYRCKLTYDNGEEQVSGNIQVTGTTNSKTNKQHIGITYNLPIISVNTGANSFPSDAGLATKSSKCGSSKYPSIHADKMKEKISVDVMMFNPDGTICYDRKARMNYRGSSSLNFKKKSYAFVTGKEKTKNLDGDVDTGKENLFGLSNGAKDKDWVLYAATPDPSMMRNRLTFDLYQKMRPGEWGVNSMYVELVVNGEYRGVYVLMDKITCNANRVNIKNENGFIVKFDKTDVVDRVENTDGDQKTFATSRTGTKGNTNGIESYGSCIDQRFEIEYPEKEDIDLWDAFYGKVQQRFEDFETALANKDYATVRTLIDYNSWADWFIITELAKNQDGFRASCIFVYDGDKIEARPLWDQELSFNNGTRVKHGIDDPDGLIITTSSVYSDAFYPPFWFTGNKGTSVTGGLLNDPCFVSLVKQKWATYQSGVCSAASIGDMVAAYNTELGNAITREAARWPYTEAARGTTTDGDYIGYYSQGEGNPAQYSYAASKNAITAWIADRSTALTAGGGLGKAINNLKGEALIFTITPSLAETTPWQQVQLTVNAPAGYEYTLNVDELKADNAIIKENGDSYGIKIPRPAAWGVGGNGTEQSKQYNVTATIEVSGENACGTISNNTATSVVKLNDITEACNPEIIKK